MKKLLIAASMVMTFIATTAMADTIPPEALQKDYDNCMGGANPQTDPARAQYCDCVRQQLSGWTTDQYGQVATEARNNSQATPEEIGQIAKTCLAKALH